MDIRQTLAALAGLLDDADYDGMLALCDRLLEDSSLPSNYRILLLDQKTKALTGLNRVREAIDVCLEELSLMETVFGPGHPHVAGVLHNLSMFMGGAERHEEALPYSERELAIVRGFAAGSNREADAIVTLAEHVYELSRFTEADTLLLEAMAIYEANDGRRSLGVSTCLNNLGRSAENQNLNEKGVDYLGEAAGIREEILGTHPDTAFTMLNYGTGLAGLGRYREAAQTLTHCAALYDALGMADCSYAEAARQNMELCSAALSSGNESHPYACACRKQ